MAQFQDMMAELMGDDSIMDMVQGMTPEEIAAMPPFPCVPAANLAIDRQLRLHERCTM